MSVENSDLPSPTEVTKNQKGAIGWILLYAIGIPVPILLILFLIRGCT
jgi:hypothetical protein